MVTVVNVDSTPIVLPHRLTPSTTPPLEKGIPTYLQLTEILVVSNCYDQVRLAVVCPIPLTYRVVKL